MKELHVLNSGAKKEPMVSDSEYIIYVDQFGLEMPYVYTGFHLTKSVKLGHCTITNWILRDVNHNA